MSRRVWARHASTPGTGSSRWRPLVMIAVPVVAAAQVLVALGGGAVSPASAATLDGTIAVSVTSARTNASGAGAGVVHEGDAVGEYKWLVTRDDTGDPSVTPSALTKCLPYTADGASQLSTYAPGDGTTAGAAAPGACQWPSTRTTAGYQEVVASGAVWSQASVDASQAFADSVTTDPKPAVLTTTDPSSVKLAPGKYLLSVTADNFQIDGAHFTIDGSGAQVPVAVTMQPYPIPLGTVRFRIFKDTLPVDGTYEADAESGLGGFQGHINDPMGEVSTDWYGNRLCTNYVHEGTLSPGDTGYTVPGDVPLSGYSRSNYDPNSPVVFDVDGTPVIDTNDPGGRCFSDVNGDIVMHNLGSDRYTASTVSPAGQKWYQTNTLEGNHDYDIWIQDGDTGFDNELTVGAEKVPNVQLGFVPYGYAVDAAGARTTPLSFSVAALSATAATNIPGRGWTRTASVVVASLGSTTLRVGQQVRLSGVNVGGRGNLFGIAFNGTHTITGLGSDANGRPVVQFLTTGGNAAFRARPVQLLTANGTMASPDAGPVVLAPSSTSFTVSGAVVELNSYVGGKGGVQNGTELNLFGANVRGPVDSPIVTLSDLGDNDQMVYVNRFGADGTFSIPNVPNGSYQLTYWDWQQDMIIDSFNVTVNDGDVNVGTKSLVDWWTQITGSVFIDTNANGKRDAGESGVPQFLLTMKERDNSLWDAGQNSATTDSKGNYVIREAYPVTKWSILEAFNTRYRTTGVTVQAENDTQEHTYLGAGVDISVLPVIGLTGRIDWGVQPYRNGENGGIAGTVTYDTTRNELDPADAVTEPYQPGIPDLTVHLYYPLHDSNGDVVHNADGSVAVLQDAAGNPLDVEDPYTSETWEAPKGCNPKQQDGSNLQSGVDQYALPPNGDTRYQCVEAPMTGWQAMPSDTTDGAFGQTVNGNYAFASTKFDVNSLYAASVAQGEALAAGTTDLTQPDASAGGEEPLANDDDYVVKVDTPLDAQGNPIFEPTAEEDVNVFEGDNRYPQENWQSGLTAADVATSAAAPAIPGQGGPISQSNGIVSGCAGANHYVHVTAAGFIGAGGSPYEGQARPLCDAKVVSIRANQAVAPNFNFYTEVPLPTHFWGLTINDLGLSHDKTQIGFGEAQPMPGVPMGIYNWAGRLVDTVITDYNGMYESTEPSTSTYNCPLPAGPCPGMYYFKGNDPGQPGHPNKEYNPRYRTIGTSFQAWPGLYTVTDTAPTMVAQIALAPGSSQVGAVQCDVSATTPNLLSVSTPYMRATSTTTTTDHPAQSLAVDRVTVTGTPAAKTVTLRVPAGTVDTTGIPPSVVVPTLTATNTPGLTNDQRTVLNNLGTAVTGGRRHTVASVTATTVVITYTNNPVAALLANTNTTTNPGTATFTASLPQYSTSVTTPSSQDVVVKGTGFGATQGTGGVTLTPASGPTNVAVTVTSWSDTQIGVRVSSSTTSAPTAGVYQLGVTNGGGEAAVNGLSFHILGSGYAPTLFQVNRPASAPDQSSANFTPKPASTDLLVHPETAIQDALDAAAANRSNAGSLVVVWPGVETSWSPTGDYFENLVVHSNVKIQGVGPGGFQGTTWVRGSRVNGMGFSPDNQQGTNWIDTVSGLGYDVTTVPDGAVVTVLGNGSFGGGFNAAVDGLQITGGAQQGQPTNVNAVNGGTTTPIGGPGALVTQGGGIYLHQRANGTQISNNVLQGNSGTYGGAIRVGTPYTATFDGATSGSNSEGWSVPNDLKNTGVVIWHNRIRDNGGTNLAGGVGIFDGSDNYVVDHNDLCGNFSAEYGGGLSHYGLSNGGKISFNRIYLNGSYDEGGGVMVAGELNNSTTRPSAGAAATTSSLVVDANVIERNISNDDGGGLRFLSAGNVPITVSNDMIDDNVSTHEGGGIALDDSTNVTIAGTTVARNVTTATAATSNGQPAPAGLSTALNSDQLQSTLPSGVPTFSRPVIRSSIFSGNLAGTWDPVGQTVKGISRTGTAGSAAGAPSYWDIGSVDGVPAGTIPFGHGLLQDTSPTGQLLLSTPAATVSTADPRFDAPYDVSVVVETNRAFPSFRQAVLVAQLTAPDTVGSYTIASTSPARGLGAGTGSQTSNGFTWPAFPSVTAFRPAAPVPGVHDVQGQPRPQGGAAVDAGADERS